MTIAQIIHGDYADFLARKVVTDPMTGLTDIPAMPECTPSKPRVRWHMGRAL